MAALGNASASLDGGTTWTPSVLQNVAVYSTEPYQPSQHFYWSPAPLEIPLSWRLPAVDRGAVDRRNLAGIAARLPLVEPRSLTSLRLDRRPEVVRRAPRPAGRPSGWRRSRKGGRRT